MKRWKPSARSGRSAPLFVRLSATDWIEGGWDVEQTIELPRGLKRLGVDPIDTSSGGNAAQAKIPLGPGYQTPFAERIRREAGILTGAVGMITSPAQAQHIVGTGQADAVFLARELLRSLLAAGRGARAGTERDLARAVSPRRAARPAMGADRSRPAASRGQPGTAARRAAGRITHAPAHPVPLVAAVLTTTSSRVRDGAPTRRATAVPHAPTTVGGSTTACSRSSSSAIRRSESREAKLLDVSRCHVS